jgi:CheY-like chemotaxis protein
VNAVASPRSIEAQVSEPPSQARLHVPARARVVVVVAEAEPDGLGWLRDALAGEVDLVFLAQGQAVLDTVARGKADLVILGHHLRDMQPAALLERLSEAAPKGPDVSNDAGKEDSQAAGKEDSQAAGKDAGKAAGKDAGKDAEQDSGHQGSGGDAGARSEVGAGSGSDEPATPTVPVLAIDPGPGEGHDVFYVLGRGLAPADVRALVRSACAERRPASTLESPGDAFALQRVLDVSRELASKHDLADASAVVVRALTVLMEADRAYCLFYDHDTGALWTEDELHAYDGNASQGLVGFAARTGTPLHASPASADPRYNRALDDPEGTGGEHLAIWPVRGGDGGVHAVLVAVRRAEGGDFPERARHNLALLAEHTAPIFDLLSRHIEAKSVVEDNWRSPLFRQEALDAYTTWHEHGDVLRVSPRWLGRVYWLLVAVFLSAIVYMTVGTVNEYSTGPAVVRMTGRTELTATTAGTIADILVVPGQRVRPEQVLVRLHDVDAVAEYRRIEGEFEAQLRNLLRAPGDPGLRQTVGSLRMQKERAAAGLEERLIRAPHGGTVSDVRIRQGQALGAGDVVLSLIDDESDLTVIAFLPGGDRPLIQPGMTMRLELTGYQYAYQNLVVDTVTDEVIGPAEVARYLGPTIGDALPPLGPVVLVRARLPSTTFQVDDDEYRYHDGMLGVAEVRVRSRTIVQHLFPELRRL